MTLLLALLLAPIAILLLVYGLALWRICFVLLREGTMVAIKRGDQFVYGFIRRMGFHLNDPHMPWFDPAKPTWEVLPNQSDTNYGYPFRQQPLARLGIYIYGLYPFWQVHEFTLDWFEAIPQESGTFRGWHRRERTWFIYAADFTYWVVLGGAETDDNEPVNVPYLLTIRGTNLYKALFSTSDWFTRATADANAVGKVYVGGATFDELHDEFKSGSTRRGEFKQTILDISDQVKDRYGVEFSDVAMQSPEIVGSNAQEIIAATTARVVARRRAQATLETARGEAAATRVKARAERDAIEAVYRKIQQFGSTGTLIRQLQAMEAPGPGRTIIWANSPFARDADLAGILQQTGLNPQDLVEMLRKMNRQQVPAQT